MRGLQGNLQAEGFRDDALFAPEQALTVFFSRANLRAPNEENVLLEDADARVLAETISADRDYPETARSAMDGFALASSDTPGELILSGEIAMGAIFPGSLDSGHAVRIPTGGALPAGADAVVPIEDAQSDGARVRIGTTVTPGDCVIDRGSDMRAGERVLEAGRYIAAAESSVLATLGKTRVRVYKKPIVAIVSSGNELVDVAANPSPAQVRDSNRWGIAARLRELGAVPKHYPILTDERDRFHDTLRAALDECDAVITSGGSSVGRLDLLPQVIASFAPSVTVHGLRVKPGKPTLLAAVGGKPVIGLPGNPVSALMIMHTAGSPIISQLSGRAPSDVHLEAQLAAPVRKRAGWTHYLPVRLEQAGGRCIAHPLMMRSAWVSLLARADGFVTVGEMTEFLDAGDSVRVTPLGATA